MRIANLLEAALHDLEIDVRAGQQFAPARRPRRENKFRCILHAAELQVIPTFGSRATPIEMRAAIS